MLESEARWWRRVLDNYAPAALYPMLNVGSSTAHFRMVEQPFIDALVFRPARDAGHRVVHLDTKQDAGVDVVGDLTDPTFRGQLATMRFNSVFCSHLLEHVDPSARQPICAAIEKVLPAGGLVFVACPRQYPYHPDPIDTGFRPSVEELARLFSGTTLVTGEEVAGDTHLDHLLGNPLRGAREVARILLPFYKPRAWRVNVGYFRFLFRRYSSTCVVLRRCETA